MASDPTSICDAFRAPDPHSICIVYHANCTDGACGAWAIQTLAHLFAEEAGCPKPDIQFFPSAPGKMPKALTEALAAGYCPDMSFVVDTAIPLQELIRLDTVSDHGAWLLDHHKTNFPLFRGYPRRVFCQERSGAGLGWDMGNALLTKLYGGQSSWPRPILVDYVEDYDLWTYRLPDAKAVTAAIMVCDRTVEAMEKLNSQITTQGLDSLISEGRGVLLSIQTNVKHAMRQARAFEFEGLVGLCVNTSVHAGEIGSALAEEGYFSVIWYLTERDGQFFAQASLRSKEGLPDVGEIAQRLGSLGLAPGEEPNGGGHRNSSGVRLPLEQFLKYVKPYDPRKTLPSNP